MAKLKLIVTDLDGSLLNSESKISEQDQKTLHMLGDKGVIRVVATGRNLFSTHKVIGDNPDIDFAIVSTGLGILDYQSRTFLKTQQLTKQEVQHIAALLISKKIDFMLHNILPDNHHVICYDARTGHPDFHLRWDWYKEFATDFYDIESLQEAAQFIGFLPHNSPQINEMRMLLPDFHIVRTTSPITHRYDWMEIFPKNVSKGDALLWLCQRLNIDIADTLCLGNDYNDLDMLYAAGKSYVTQNAPAEIKEDFAVTASNNESPLTNIVREYEDWGKG